MYPGTLAYEVGDVIDEERGTKLIKENSDLIAIFSEAQ
jgi:hypothetical protein